MKMQTVVDQANDNLSGYQNAVDQRSLLNYANEGVTEVWSVLKNLESEYFLTMSQATQPSQNFYFSPLSITQREYDLPSDLREIKFIECTTVGYTDLKFIFKDPTDEGFRNARRGSNEDTSPTPNLDMIMYTVIGKKTLVLSDYPPAVITLIVWYVRSLPSFELGDDIDEILEPYSQKIADYVARKVSVAVTDVAAFNMWRETWREDLITVGQTAGDRNGADPIFVQGMGEDDEW